MTFLADRAYHRAWEQRQRDRHVARPSNAKYRCVDCRVEVCKHARRCRICGYRARQARKA